MNITKTEDGQLIASKRDMAIFRAKLAKWEDKTGRTWQELGIEDREYVLHLMENNVNGDFDDFESADIPF